MAKGKMPAMIPENSSRRAAFTPKELDQIEKMAMIGMKVRQIAQLIGTRPEVFYVIVCRHKKAYLKGQVLKNNLYVLIANGRSKGDTAIHNALFDEATTDKDKGGRNTTALLFLAKSRLKMREPAADVNLNHSLVFETQIGQDGVVRSGSQPMDLGADEGEQEEWMS